MESQRWLLLAHQLPTRPSNARVKTWRRLQDIGAVPARNSVYVLPNTEQCREDFEWMRTEIVALGGEATVFAADALDRDGNEAIVTLFQRARAINYRALKQDADRLFAANRKKKPSSPSKREGFRRVVRALRERMAKIERIDFGQAKGRSAAEDAIERLERLVSDRAAGPRVHSTDRLAPDTFRRRRWVTRPRPGVDRMASAWLIRRFIDPEATFAFVDRPSESDIPFDMYEGEFSHQGSLCTFETLAERFGIQDPDVTRVGRIVHDLDMKETRYDLPEAAAVGQMVEGLRQVHADDHALLSHGIGMFEALARSFAAMAPAVARRTKRRHGRPKRA